VADPARRLPRNAPGGLFVDDTCIDCATCREMAPSVYAHAPDLGASVVARQPQGPEETRLALGALVACPTASIGAPPGTDLREARHLFPLPVLPDVSFCGYTSRDSFGAWSWLVTRPEGNVLVDSPRAASTLLDRIEAMGGVATMFLTHRDDVADHEAIRRRFGCERVMHRADLGPETRGVERVLEGDEPVALASDLLAIPVPGHTAGSLALLFREEVLFSGDHLWGDGRALDASREVCWSSWPDQIRSVERLVAHRFSAVLPGHGPVWRGTPEEARDALSALARRMRSAPA
jgi:glyoxylase-like metal-dependent hydrolase (beta-lactamase superfamily II)/ferredoxin